MIIAELNDLKNQIAFTPHLKTALDWLVANCTADLPDGRIEIDGSKVYALVQSYVSKPEPRFEAHQRYLDIQYVTHGKELFGWAAVTVLVPADPYNPEKDVVKGAVPAEEASFVRLSAGQLAVVWPSDAHAPGMADGEPAPVRKIVIKVVLDSITAQ
jgi:YhcH/YjgK/YiaL family protein